LETKKRNKQFYLDSSRYFNCTWNSKGVYSQTQFNAIDKCTTYFGSSERTCVNMTVCILTRRYVTLNKENMKTCWVKKCSIYYFSK